jgi:hypothetical protein
MVISAPVEIRTDYIPEYQSWVLQLHQPAQCIHTLAQHVTPFYQTTRHHITGDSNFHSRRRKDLKSPRKQIL